MTGTWLLEYGVRDSCIESLPDWNWDLRLSVAVPAPTLQDGSTRKERKHDPQLSFLLHMFRGFPIGQIHLEEERQGGHCTSHRFHPSKVQSRVEKAGGAA